jgi:hypothetical protein
MPHLNTNIRSDLILELDRKRNKKRGPRARSRCHSQDSDSSGASEEEAAELRRSFSSMCEEMDREEDNIKQIQEQTETLRQEGNIEQAKAMEAYELHYRTGAPWAGNQHIAFNTKHTCVTTAAHPTFPGHQPILAEQAFWREQLVANAH